MYLVCANVDWLPVIVWLFPFPWTAYFNIINFVHRFFARFHLVWHRDTPYIQKGGFRGLRNPKTILNFPQKDYLRTRKLSILQCVLEIKPKLLPTFLPKITNYHQLLPIITKIIDLCTFVAKFYCRDLRTYYLLLTPYSLHKEIQTRVVTPLVFPVVKCPSKWREP